MEIRGLLSVGTVYCFLSPLLEFSEEPVEVCVGLMVRTHTKFVRRCNGHAFCLEFRMLCQVFTLQGNYCFFAAFSAG